MPGLVPPPPAALGSAGPASRAVGTAKASPGSLQHPRTPAVGNTARNISLREKYLSVATHMSPEQDGTHILNMCPDQDINPQLFDMQDDAPTEPPGQDAVIIFYIFAPSLI